MEITNETKAVLRTEGVGRVIGFVKSSEPGKISLAVPNDRVVMTPAQARALATWLVDEANKADRTPPRTMAGWQRAEAEHREQTRTALDADRARRF